MRTGALHNSPASVAAVALIVLLIAGSAGVQAARDRWFPRPPVAEHLLYVRSGDAVRRLAGAYQPLFADIYWIKTVQHYGSDRLGRTAERRYQLLYPLLDLTTSLDPYFTIAYRFGAFFLADVYPDGAGRPDQAIALLEKGLRVEPQKWEYAQDIGFVYYWAVGDYARAAEWYLRASKMPGAPNWMALVAASMAGGVDRRAARFLWSQILATADVDWIRRGAERRLAQFDAMDAIDAINAHLRPFVALMPDGPITWERLASAGAIRRVPLDPAGVPFALNPWWGEVTVAPESPLFPMPIERPPARAGAAR